MSITPQDLQHIIDALKMQQDQAVLDLQRQQMAAAWISAGAAAVQAIGAFLAIWFSVTLARDSAKRERDAEIASAHRIAAAEAAALTRAKSAETKAHNAPLEVVLSLGDLYLSYLEKEAARFSLITDGASYGFRVDQADAQNLREAVALAKAKISGAEEVKALNEIEALTRANGSNYQIAQANQVAATFNLRAQQVKHALRELEYCLRPYDEAAKVSAQESASTSRPSSPHPEPSGDEV